MRTVLGSGRDPLCVFLLATLGLSELFGCSGRSVAHDIGDDSGGTAGMPPTEPDAGGAPPAGGVPPMAQGGRSPGGAAGAPRGGRAGAPPVAGAGIGGGSPVPTEGVLGCDSAAPYLGEQTGLESCRDGTFVHRATPGKCEPTPLKEHRYPGESSGAGVCHSDSECEGIPNGRCYMRSAPIAQCISTCESDADCSDEELCLCDADVNHCVHATCQSDTDCGEGLLCVNAKQPCGADLGIFACQTKADACTTACPNGTCALVDKGGSEERVCMPGAGGSCGRPFLVEGHALVAELGPAGDWLSKDLPLPIVAGLAPELRAALATWWTNAALMEHASIAAFARFTLELLALGAPSRLVEDATSAMADEQRHARTCFAVASAYAGKPLGPGALELGRALESTELERIAVTTFLEGCIGETVAAVEARELSASARDAAITEILRTIADDEARHSALAWRFLRWALALGGPALARRIDAALTRELDVAAAACATATAPADDPASSHGMLSASARLALRAEVLREIVAPCLGALTRGLPSAALVAGG
jgi:hypothetical protein